jgi:uncharacterized protein
MVHSGSLLILPSGIHGWRPASLDETTGEDVQPILKEKTGFVFLLMGAGRSVGLLPRPVMQLFRDASVPVEVMDTGAAVRTFNILLAEHRPPAAALIAV